MFFRRRKKPTYKIKLLKYDVVINLTQEEWKYLWMTLEWREMRAMNNDDMINKFYIDFNLD